MRYILLLLLLTLFSCSSNEKDIGNDSRKLNEMEIFDRLF